MDMELKASFVKAWREYFSQAELPLVFFYASQPGNAELVKPAVAHQCFIGVLSRVRQGAPLSFNSDSIGCGGGKRFLGFTQELRPNFEFFLSCGIPGQMEGERYKKSPELVLEAVKNMPKLEAPAPFITWKRWDKLEESEEPEVVVFFATPDVLSGLFTLANFDQEEPHGVVAPFSSGCGAIVTYPYLERATDRPRAFLGMFDVSARPFVPKTRLTFAVPMQKFAQMVKNMDESFLTTSSWGKVKKRIGQE